MRSTCFRSYLAFAVAMAVIYGLLRGHGLGQAVVYDLVSLSSLAAVVAGARRSASGGRLPWLLLAVGVGCQVVGDFCFFLSDGFGVSLSSWSSDGWYLVSYGFLGSALFRFGASRVERLDSRARQLIDSLILFVSGFAAFWFFALDPVVDSGRLAPKELLFTLLYPALDLMLLALALRVVFSSGRWPASYAFLNLAVGLMLVGDLVWRLALAAGAYAGWMNLFFVAAYGFWGLAALHPSAAGLVRMGVGGGSAAGRRLLLLGLAAIPAPLALLLSRDQVHGFEDHAVIAAFCLMVPLLGMLRYADMLRALRATATDAAEAHRGLEAVIAASPVPVCVVSSSGEVQLWNRAAELVSGYEAAEVLGAPVPLVPAEDPERVATLYAQALAGTELRAVAVSLRDKQGAAKAIRVSTAPLHDGQGSVVALFEDVSVEVAQAKRIEYLASHDPLTSLANRRTFEQLLARAAAKRAAGEAVTLVLLDLDNFKLVNDTGGHALGDRMLVELSGILRQSIREDDTVARLSGDEFALVVAGNAAEAEAVSLRLLRSVEEYRLRTAEEVFDITISAGIYPLEPGDTPEQAFGRADQALYEAKARGKNKAHRWCGTPPTTISASRAWSPKLKDALHDGTLEAHLQPIVSLRDGQVAFHEALCRIRSRVGQPVPAAAFIEHAETLGLMPQIDLRILEQVGALLRDDDGLRVFVNLSASSFDDELVSSSLERLLTDLAPNRLGIEITEHTSLRDLEHTVQRLERLRSLGALVAIDDFGTGFSSFQHLATLPCDLVKIPPSLSIGGEASEAIAAAITTVAHAYERTVIIEGIETAAQAQTAKQLGIEYAQGWHYGHPIPYLTHTELARLAS